MGCSLNLADARTALNSGEDVIGVLRRVWHLLSGGDCHAMAAYKLERIENAKWRDPVATFAIQRHGGLDGEVQTWRADLAMGTAELIAERPLRARPTTEPWDERPVAAELARLIQAGEDDPRLDWRGARRHAVKVITTKALPPGSPHATLAEAKRLRAALAKELGDEWTRDMGTWVKEEPS